MELRTECSDNFSAELKIVELNDKTNADKFEDKEMYAELKKNNSLRRH